tara:strand:+ start:15432 stop:16214 length:783 start_codon:yes stop_codon:yes gene_type:complete
MAIAKTLAGAKTAATGGGLAAGGLGAALALKKSKYQKSFEKDIDATEAKIAKDQGKLDQTKVAEGMGAIQSALTQQRAMTARGPQTGMQQQQQRDLMMGGLKAQARVASDLLKQEGQERVQALRDLSQRKLQAAQMREAQKSAAIGALTADKGKGQVGATIKGQQEAQKGGGFRAAIQRRVSGAGAEPQPEPEPQQIASSAPAETSKTEPEPQHILDIQAKLATAIAQGNKEQEAVLARDLEFARLHMKRDARIAAENAN